MVAIWYDLQLKYWLIGKISDIGTKKAWIHSVDDKVYDCPQQVPKDQWYYWDGSTMQEAGSNDISFQCKGRKKKVLQQ